tara:strand:+ start:9 stop:410 length:402 start_codon:yes stop_codon:yes gene_type:complete
MLSIEIKDKMWDGTIDWKVVNVDMTLGEFTAMRQDISKKASSLYATFHPLNLTASGGSMDIMSALGWIEKNDMAAMRKKSRQLLPSIPFHSSVFMCIATYYCRVTHVDDVKLKRRKCFQDQTYSKWASQKGGE